MAVTALSSPSSITIGSESFLNVEKLVRSLHICCDAPESMTHFRALAAAARAEEVSQKGSQFPVVARAAVAVAIFTFHHFFICLKETQSTLTCPGSPHCKQMHSLLFPPS